MSSDGKCVCVLPWNNRECNNYVSWNNLISLQLEDSLLIAQWNQRQMSIFQLREKEVRDVTVSALNSASELCQNANFPETVLQVFEWTGILYVLTTSGFLKVLEFNESTIRYLKNGTCCFKTIFSLPPPKKVLAACPLNRNVILIATFLNGHIFIDIYNVDISSDDMELFFVDSLPLEKQEQKDGTASAIMCLCSPLVASELMGAQSDQYFIVLVGLNSGSVLWLPFIKDASVVPEVRKLYHAGRKVQDIISLKETNNVFVLLEGGVVILIRTSKDKDQQVASSARSLRFDTVALPGSIREFCFSLKSDSILCSDGIQCWLVREATGKTRTILLPLKGVTGLLALRESDICLATTKHNTFYAVNVTSDFSSCVRKDEQTIQKCCDLETPYQYICELKEKTNDLLQVEAALKLEDSVLAGISAAARGNILRTGFRGRVLVHDVDALDFQELTNSPIDTMYKLCVEVTNNSNIDLSANLWNLSISILTRDGGVLSKTVPLPSAFDHSFPFSADIFVRLPSVDLVSDPKVTVNLIAELPEPNQGRWISIPVFEENLDLSYFLTVVFDTDKSDSQSSAVPIDKQINEIVGKGSKEQQRSVSYSINLPQQWRNVADLMNSLLSKCQHRCEDFLKQIKGETDLREFNLLFGDALVNIAFNRSVSVLTISGTSTEMVHAVKLWVIRVLASSDGGVFTSPNVVSNAKLLWSVLENEQLKPSIDVNHLIEIHSEIRNNVSVDLPL